MELRDALTQIAEIRRQMAKAEVFRGYRSAPVAFSGGVALAAWALQHWLIANPAELIGSYLGLWISVAALSFGAVALEMTARMTWRGDRAQLEPTRLALEQFVPPIMAGALITLILPRHFPLAIGLLPGLWQLLYGLAIFASARLLPREILLVGLFYAGSGLLLMMGARDGASLAPWCMGVPFGVGQLATAAILYWKLERNR